MIYFARNSFNVYVIALWFVYFCFVSFFASFHWSIDEDFAFWCLSLMLSGDCTFGFYFESICSVLLDLVDVAIEMGRWQLFIHGVIFPGNFLLRLWCIWEWCNLTLFTAEVAEAMNCNFHYIFKSRLNVIKLNLAWFLRIIFFCFGIALEMFSEIQFCFFWYLNAFDRITDLVVERIFIKCR